MVCFPRAYRCDSYHYLDVSYLDGRREHITGPVQVFFNNWVHESIQVIKHEFHVATDRQCLDVVYRDGRFERICGPANLRLDPFVHQSIRVMSIQRHVASQGEYLIVQYKDGRKKHMRGPCELAFHPLEHERIEMHEALKLAANEAVVVYRRDPHLMGGSNVEPELVAKLQVLPPSGEAAAAAKNGKGPLPASIDRIAEGVPQLISLEEAAPQAPLLTTEAAGQEGAMHVERRVVHGPAVFMPDSNEWLHSFSWHGSVKADGKGSKTGYVGDVKVPHALNFQVIRCMPDSMYLSVRDVRTVDDANLTVHLMLFYELKSIETMLDSTNDMIGDFVNAASADVMTFASRLTYETFLGATAELSKTANFPILVSRMEQTGTALLKVVYRGYGASAQLQEMHDQAISRRTKLRLEADAAREEQEKKALELRCRQERAGQEQELEAAAARHRLEVQSLQKTQERELLDEAHAQELRYAQEKMRVDLAAERSRHEAELQRQKELTEITKERLAIEAEAELRKFEGMKQLGVDLTQYLVAQATERPDHHIKLDHAGGAGAPNLHLEMPAPARSRN